jgi:anti-anti-sigma factor
MRPLDRLIATAPAGVAGLSVVAFPVDHAGVLHVAIDGEADISNASWLAAAVVEMMTLVPRRQVRIDLSGLRFLDAAGIRALLTCAGHAAARGRQLTLTDPQPVVRRLLEITGLLHLILPPHTDKRRITVSERTG